MIFCGLLEFDDDDETWQNTLIRVNYQFILGIEEISKCIRWIFRLLGSGISADYHDRGDCHRDMQRLSIPKVEARETTGKLFEKSHQTHENFFTRWNTYRTSTRFSNLPRVLMLENCSAQWKIRMCHRQW